MIGVKEMIRKWRGGFTLMELMIVVAVLAIIAAILIPNFRGITAEAKNSTAKADLRNLKMAVILYQNQFNVLPDDSSIEKFEECLQNYSPRVVDRVPTDPWSPDGSKYHYDVSADGTTFGIWSVGQNGTSETTIGNDTCTFGANADDIVATNAATISGSTSGGVI
ncbi:type II secretion system protein GspG [Candidatus Calescamantes bacterium]|nr:type II secretion system protein GspG [Candidatus Calescamantes bacterium]